jgi:hypothetical protein
MNRRVPVAAILIAASVAALTLLGLRLEPVEKLGVVRVEPNLEDRLPDGSPFNPSTQSFLRGHHWLDRVDTLEIKVDSKRRGFLRLRSPDGQHQFEVRNLPLDQLVPRLHYRAASPPDAFDAFNLMMAEYSRNGLSVPKGDPGDTMAHFQTSLAAERPWKLNGDYQFEPLPDLRPIRTGVINNCLAPGLWELNATDRAGEIYHSWFRFPEGSYIRLTAATNRLDDDFVFNALQWRTEPVPSDLDRLRKKGEFLGNVAIEVLTDADSIGYSSQDSRRKVAGGFAMVGEQGAIRRASRRSDLTSLPARFPDFVEPGKYSLEARREFDLSFLARPLGAEVRRATPLTSYDFLASDKSRTDERYLEVVLHLGEYRLVLGNLPAALLVPQEEFVIHGFGVGILSAADLAERRKFLIEEGPAPSFAYLLREHEGKMSAVNSHDLGVEQVFIRSHSLREEEPWWEITVASFERIVDIIKYRVEIPRTLHEELRDIALGYISPVYLSYQDDNLR